MIRRAVDIILALCGLLLAFPVMLLLAAIIFIRDGWPVLYIEKRTGLCERPFGLYKFRSMTIAADADGKLLPDAERLPEWGRALRSTSLDELPQLWNVLRGDMSLIGPRPLPVRYLPRYSARQRLRHRVRPGITGWAQVHGRNALNWEQKFDLDVWYVEHRNPRIDLAIIGMTLLKVIKRTDINQSDNATMPEFLGERPEKEKKRSL
jgi:lipopolysaccharide/colanic/teichoic acid biosynthesis glycosyltransferase